MCLTPAALAASTAFLASSKLLGASGKSRKRVCTPAKASRRLAGSAKSPSTAPAAGLLLMTANSAPRARSALMSSRPMVPLAPVTRRGVAVMKGSRGLRWTPL